MDEAGKRAYPTAMSVRSAHAREVYDAHVRGLPRDVQLQLVAVIADEASLHNEPGTTPRSPKLLDLAGLGAEIWQGVDAGDYVRELRDEWDRLP